MLNKHSLFILRSCKFLALAVNAYRKGRYEYVTPLIRNYDTNLT